tara:strand:- start:30442 stop:31560 length:1119 start_codon:yes stop_codon:yes gene_type:complete
MATGPLTKVADVVVPEIFTPYVQQITEEKARLVQSGILARDEFLDGLLAGGGLTFKVPSYRDLDNEDENISTDDVADVINLTDSAVGGVFSGIAAGTTLTDSVPKKIETDTEIAVRMNRNQSWSSASLARSLAGSDPLAAIGARVGFYWVRRLQAAFIATMQGISKDNGVNDTGDYVNDISGVGFVDGVTNFSAEAFLDASLTMGDSMESLTAVMVHSVVFNRMQKNNLIDFIPDATGMIQIPTFLGREVIVDDGMPTGTSVVLADGTAGSAGMYETWLFGPGAASLGIGGNPDATEVERKPSAGNGGGQEILHSRVQWTIHPSGHAYVGTPADGGPSNAVATDQLNIATSWDRRRPERKQINFARLVTRES